MFQCKVALDVIPSASTNSSNGNSTSNWFLSLKHEMWRGQGYSVCSIKEDDMNAIFEDENTDEATKVENFMNMIQTKLLTCLQVD